MYTDLKLVLVARSPIDLLHAKALVIIKESFFIGYEYQLVEQKTL